MFLRGVRPSFCFPVLPSRCGPHLSDVYKTQSVATVWRHHSYGRRSRLLNLSAALKRYFFKDLQAKEQQHIRDSNIILCQIRGLIVMMWS